MSRATRSMKTALDLYEVRDLTGAHLGTLSINTVGVGTLQLNGERLVVSKVDDIERWAAMVREGKG